MNSHDLQIAFLMTTQCQKFFKTVGPVVNARFSSYDQLGAEWEQRLKQFETKYMLVFVEDIKRKFPGQEHLALRSDFVELLIKDSRLGHIIFTLNAGEFDELPAPDDQYFLRYWSIDAAAYSGDQISEAVGQFRMEFSEWL